MHIINHDDPKKLRTLIDLAENPRVKLRITALCLALEGQTSSEIAAELGCHRVSVCNWVKAYNQNGLSTVESSKVLGRPRKLPPSVLMQIKDRLHTKIDVQISSKSAIVDGMIQILNEEYQVKYSRAWMYGILDQLA